MGSYPLTFMPSETAAFATLTPMAPRPTTPSVFPAISPPTKFFLPFSTVGSTASQQPARFLAQVMPPSTSRPHSSRAQMTSSLTALALAPGVLKTTTPSLAHSSRGMLLTPAPARAMATSSGFLSYACMSAERTMMASGDCTCSPTSYSSFGSKSVAAFAMLFSSLTL